MAGAGPMAVTASPGLPWDRNLTPAQLKKLGSDALRDLLSKILDHLAPVRAEQLGPNSEVAVLEHAEAGDRRRAGRAERAREGPLGHHAIIGDLVVHRGQHALRHRVVGAALDPDHRLPRRREHDFGRDRRSFIDVEPLEASRGKQGRVHLARLHAGEPRFDIAAQRHDLHVRPQALHLRRAAR